MSLRDIAIKYGTDKAGHHEYCEAYEFFLAPLRHKHFNMLELGIGGYEFPDKGGESLRMWREYFAVAKIHGVDVYDKNFKIPGVNMHKGSQDDVFFLEKLNETAGPFSLIVDDASHVQPFTLMSFELLWPLLLPGGMYVVEDCHTSYWRETFHGGGDHLETVMEYFKEQTDWLNSEHWEQWKKDQERKISTPVFEDVESIHFFKEIIFIRKKL